MQLGKEMQARSSLVSGTSEARHENGSSIVLASDQSILLRRKETRLVPIIQKTHGDVSKMEENLVHLKYLWRNCNLKRDLNKPISQASASAHSASASCTDGKF